MPSQYHFYFITPLAHFSFFCQAYFIAHPAEYFINCLAEYHFYFITPLAHFSFLCQAYVIACPAEYFINCLANIISVSLHLSAFFITLPGLFQCSPSRIFHKLSAQNHFSSGTFFITLPCLFHSSPLRVLMGDLDCGHMTNV